MKTSVLYAGLSSPHAGWVAIDELAELFSLYFKAEILSPKLIPDKWPINLIRSKHYSYEPLHTSGGDVLIVVARGPGDLGLINSISGCRKKFDKIYGFVTDSYFKKGFPKETSLFDAITVTAYDDIDFPKSQFDITVHQLYQGTDCLTWAPREYRIREIDIMSFGRTPASYHNQFSLQFHTAKTPYLYLHSPLGNIAGPSVHLERSMLFKLLHRTRISLAFHLLVEPEGNRPRSMMVTSRWLESLLSGCIVAGRRPVSRMAEEMLFWPKATIELSENPEIASDELIKLLSVNDSLEEQRYSNIYHTITNHDWRYRIELFCKIMNLPIPQLLTDDFEHLYKLGNSIKKFI